MSTGTNLLPIEGWNVVSGVALDDSANPTEMLSIRLKFGLGGPAATGTLIFRGERGGPGIGALLGADLNVQPDPADFDNYFRVLSAGRDVGAYIAVDDTGQLLSFFLAFRDSEVGPV